MIAYVILCLVTFHVVYGTSSEIRSRRELPTFPNDPDFKIWFKALTTRATGPSYCTQYIFGGTSGVHSYTCCNNCDDFDTSCDGYTYQGGGSDEDYCSSCGEGTGGGSVNHNFNCISCGQQDSCENKCSSGFVGWALKNIPGGCPFWSRCFRLCCGMAQYINKKRNTDKMVDVGDFCGDFVCQVGEETIQNCPIDCCPYYDPESCYQPCNATSSCCDEKCGIDGCMTAAAMHITSKPVYFVIFMCALEIMYTVVNEFI